jgi:acetylornithine deacetylase
MSNPQEATVLNAIDEGPLIDDLAALIGIRSLGGAESPAQEWMAERLRSLGADLDCWTIDFQSLSSHPAFTMEVPRTSGLGVVGALGDGAGPTLVLNGHVDVVPPGDLPQWTTDPWKAAVRDGCVFGRGACDMKGGLAAAIAALRAISVTGVKLRGRVSLQSVVAEEDGGAGTLATIVRGHRGDGAVSMEPTELNLATAHAGALSFRITIHGLSAHGCIREEGVSTIELFRPIHDALLDLEAQRNARLRTTLFGRYRLPFALSIGRVAAGDWPSSVPDLLTCEGRYGIAPGEDAAVAKSAFEQAVATAAIGHPYLVAHPPDVEWWGGQFLPAQTDERSSIVTTIAGAIASVTGRSVQNQAMTYGADMRLLVNHAGMPSVLFGPGSVRHAHRPNEFVRIEDLMTAARVLAIAALRFANADH